MNPANAAISATNRFKPRLRKKSLNNLENVSYIDFAFCSRSSI